MKVLKWSSVANVYQSYIQLTFSNFYVDILLQTIVLSQIDSLLLFLCIFL